MNRKAKRKLSKNILSASLVISALSVAFAVPASAEISHRVCNSASTQYNQRLGVEYTNGTTRILYPGQCSSWGARAFTVGARSTFVSPWGHYYKGGMWFSNTFDLSSTTTTLTLRGV